MSWQPAGTLGGSGEQHRVHIQNTPSTDWPVVHNMGYRPNVAVIRSDGIEISDGVIVDHIDENSLFVRSGIAIAGRAELS